MQLPNALWRRIAAAKVSDYLLNVRHPEGSGKARFFMGFGFRAERSDDLIAALFDHPIRNPVADHITTEFGEKYVVRCNIDTPDGRNPCIVSIWILEQDGAPRLVTAYPA